jgi:peptidoglycan/xylan/chitin deacetylase (PgdA/CDA1 family)
MKNLRILFYHGISSVSRGKTAASTMPSVNEFRAQMAYLKEHCSIISLDEILYHCRMGTCPQKLSVAVTFDDGLASTLLAAPILKSLNIPATVFLSTRYIGTDELPWFTYLNAILEQASRRHDILKLSGQEFDAGDPASLKRFRAMCKRFILAKPYSRQIAMLEVLAEAVGTSLFQIRCGHREFMTWDEVGQLASEGVAMASHTWSHVDLRTLTGGELEQEFSQAKADLWEHLGLAHTQFVAYPDGRFDSRVLAVARRYHDLGLADRYRYASWGDIHRLPRRNIGAGGIEEVKRGLSSGRELASWVKQGLRGFFGGGYLELPEAQPETAAEMPGGVVMAEK